MSSQPFLKVTVDRTEELMETLRKFKRDAVLVGVPEETNPRKVTEEGPINNATLMAINEFGSPANNIPARPAMAIGIKNAQAEIIELMKKGATMALTQGFKAIDVFYNRAGFVASNSIKKVINSQEGLLPPSDATLKAREARGFKGTKSLIVTGQLRNSITFVINGEVKGKG